MSEFGQDLIVRARLVLPRPRRYLLQRPALNARILQAQRYRLSIVQANTGYGKSTALVAALQTGPLPLLWYSITESDQEPLLFLLHLIYAFRSRWIGFGAMALQVMQQAGTAPFSHRAVIDAISNEFIGLPDGRAVLVLDDYHLVNRASPIGVIVDHLLEVLPPQLHLIIAARQRPALKTLTDWSVKGELWEIGQRDLAFSADEIDALFRTEYQFPLTAGQVQRLAEETEGWVIALQIIWHSLQSGVASTPDQILAALPSSLEDLFAYLAREVLSRRPLPIQRFLLRTSILRQLEPAACDWLLGWHGSAALLQELYDDNLFLVHLGDAYRYHHLFHDFLRHALQIQAVPDAGDVRSLHGQAAFYYQERRNPEEAIAHWLAAEEYEAAADLMARTGEGLVRNGRLDVLSEWVTALPLATLEDYPILMIQMGELCRFASRFDEALAWYRQAQERYLSLRDVAGASRALRGQAVVYLDTVRPIKAESLLQEALRLVDGQPDREEKARLLDLMAENMTNRGKSEEAAALRRQARELLEEGPSDADRHVRVLLRTGRLDEVWAILEERAADERRRFRPEQFREPRSHRETLLVLSLLHSWQGRPEQARTCAQDGIAIGRSLGSPFIEAVGYMRLGHAWQISDRVDKAERALSCYRQAMEIGERLAVPRTKVEALWGLCRLHGFHGDLAEAERCAQEGIQVALAAGDEWIAALTTAMLAACYVLAGDDQAEPWLDRSANAFRDSGDHFGQCVTQLWRCLLYHRRGEPPKVLTSAVDDLLARVRTHNLQFLFNRVTFLGPPDPASAIPLLIAGRRDWAGPLLIDMGVAPETQFHPGYTLRVNALGRFAVRRGQEVVEDGEWHREKARQLFELLLIRRDRFLWRDEINAALWPDAVEEAAEAQFKVTLNALNRTIEPARPPRAPTLFVQRRGSSYGIHPGAPLWLDAAEFEKQTKRAAKAPSTPEALENYEQALLHYQGDLLPDCLYNDWSRDERERLRQLHLQTCLRAAELLLEQDDMERAIALAERALASDNCCEAAYRLLIRAYLKKDEQVAARRVYERCELALRQEIGVEPMLETAALLGIERS